MKNQTSFILIYLFGILTIFLGMYLNEFSGGGAEYDFNIHLNTIKYFDAGIIDALKNYGDMENMHSPIFIIFLKYLIYYDLTWARILYIIICSTSSIVFYLCLKEKLNSKPSLILFCLAQLLFVSPYFRSLTIWPGDESVSILFLLLSILFYFKFEKNKFNNKKFIYLSLNVFLLAICSYFRPTYSFFSIFFFYKIVLINFDKEKFLNYFLLSLFLALPAIYYFFIMKVDFYSNYRQDYNPANILIFISTIFFFYLIPFIYSYKAKPIFNKFNLILSILFFLIVFLFFSYTFNYDGKSIEILSGGGIFYRINRIFFDNNIFFILFGTLTFYLCIFYLELSKFNNFILVFVLFFFEIDNYFYQETYDPLLLICYLLLFNIKIINSYLKNFNIAKFNYLFIFLSLFYLLALGKNHGWFTQLII